MEMQKEAEEKQQQKMLESEELFDNIHALPCHPLEGGSFVTNSSILFNAL